MSIMSKYNNFMIRIFFFYNFNIIRFLFIVIIIGCGFYWGLSFIFRMCSGWTIRRGGGFFCFWKEKLKILLLVYFNEF